MTPNQLVDDRLDSVADREVSLFLGDLRQEHSLVQEIAELLAQRLQVAAVERVEQFVGFFQDEGAEGSQGLIPVPRAPVGTAQRPHHVNESIEPCPSRICHAREALARYGTIRFLASRTAYVRGGGAVPESGDRPEISFVAFVLSLASNAAVHFGDLPDPMTNEHRPPDLEAAAQLIGIIAMLEEKTRGNLSAEERQLVEQVLFELRMRFVEAKKGQSPIIQP
jgi:hypothetical protein